MEHQPSLISLALATSVMLGSCQADAGSPTLRSDRTPSPPETQSATRRPSPTKTPALVTPAPTESSEVSQSIISPDGNWEATASFTYLPDGYRIQLQVTSQDGSTSWSPVDYVGDGEGYLYPFPKYWSPDSRFFFFDERVAGGSCDFFSVSEGWKSVDTTTGRLSDYPLPLGRSHAISPDGSLLAYASVSSPSALTIRNLTTGSEVSVEVPPGIADAPNAQAGSLVWNPQSSAVVFATATSDFCSEQRPSFQLLRFDPSTQQLTLLIPENEVLVRPVLWRSEGAILVQDWDNRSWWISEDTGQAVPAPSE